jgi:hypothetical protein
MLLFPRSAERGPIEAASSGWPEAVVRMFPRSAERGPIEARAYGLDTVIGDQHFDLAIVKEYAAHGIKVIIEPQSEGSNYEMFKNFKAVIRRGLTAFPDDPLIRKDVLSLRVMKGGMKPKVAAPERAGFHDDISKACSVVLMKLLPLGAGVDVGKLNEGAVDDRDRLLRERGFPVPEREDALPVGIMAEMY